ncbi:MAG TPA: toll/interleukin-1 receptor domain-containing protein [Pyrinomonadaceae bacterium]|nr:toll/interleukin-1 receptor domain-containing protein [Pyrinomonadaceae bacterium]
MPVFVSHNFKDEAIYSTLCLVLDSARMERWDPSTMSPGESLSDQLRNAIRMCEVCIFVATRRSIESPWCLAELGAFWGAGKKVLVFLCDPDLQDSMLPPQFKGNLLVSTADELIKAARVSIDQHRTAVEKATQEAPYEFFETSGNYGTQKDWQGLLINTHHRFDVMGVALGAWRKSPGFSKLALSKPK